MCFSGAKCCTICDLIRNSLGVSGFAFTVRASAIWAPDPLLSAICTMLFVGCLIPGLLRQTFKTAVWANGFIFLFLHFLHLPHPGWMNVTQSTQRIRFCTNFAVNLKGEELAAECSFLREWEKKKLLHWPCWLMTDYSQPKIYSKSKNTSSLHLKIHLRCWNGCLKM